MKGRIPADKRLADKTEIVSHDPSNYEEAFRLASSQRAYFGLFYRNLDKLLITMN